MVGEARPDEQVEAASRGFVGEITQGRVAFFAREGAQVIINGRSQQSVDAALDGLRKAVPNAQVFGFAGDLDLAIAIRTATISGGVARVQAGAGLVADSDPDAEFRESTNKAAAPLRAVAVANAMRRLK